jgi:anti-sigma B factor antagonist
MTSRYGLTGRSRTAAAFDIAIREAHLYGAQMRDSDRTAPDARAELMTLDVTRVGSAAVVTVTGELDLHTARELMTVVDETLEWPELSGVVVDLTAVSFLGSSGLGTLAELATRTTTPAGAAGYRSEPPQPLPPLRLVAPQENAAVIRPWQTMNLQQILPLYPDLASALESL